MQEVAVLVYRPGPVRSLGEALQADGPRPRPLVPQALLVLVVASDAVLRVWSGAGFGPVPWSGLVVLALASVVVVVRHRGPWTPPLVAALGMTDLLAVGLVRADAQVTGPVMIAALPAYYLGRHLGRRGVVLTLVGVALFVVPPDLLLPQPAPQLARLATGCVFVVVAAWAAALTAEKLGDERRTTVAIADSVPVGLSLLDPAGRFVAVNPTQEQLIHQAYPGGDTGSEGIVFGADGRTPLPLEDYPSARAARGEEFDDVVVWVGDDPLTQRALSVSARVVRGRDGEVTGAALACHDITGFLGALRIKDDFVSGVSHELRTPLTSVCGHLELALDRDDLDADLRPHLDVSLRNARRLNRLVDDLLLSARSDRGLVTLRRTRVDLVDVVSQSVAAATPAVRARGQRLELDAPDRLDAVVDASRIGQVVDNLLSNAIKFGPDGGRVRIRLRDEDERWELTVSDEGPGIDPVDQDQLFAKFYRSTQAVDDAVPGVGLGLSIVHDIVVAHGGRIEVGGEPGAGSTFVVRVPGDGLAAPGATVPPRREGGAGRSPS